MIKYRLDDLGDITTGNTPSKKNKLYYNSDDIPFAKPDDLVGSKIIRIGKTKEYISEVAENKARVLGKETVLFTCIGTIGKIAVIDCDRMAFNQQINAIQPNIDIVYPQYLAYALYNERDKIQAIANAPVVPIINKTQFSQVEILIDESVERQKKVVDVLDKAQSIIDKRKKQIQACDELVKAAFIEMFGDPFSNPKGFEIVLFEQLVEYMGDIGSNGANSVVSANLIMSDVEDYALMIRTTNFTNNDFTNNVKYVSKEVYDFFKKSKVYGGELIFNKIGSAGINFVMPNLNRPVSLGLNQIMVRTNDKVCMIYLHNLLNTDYGKHQINSRVQGAVTKSITKGAIKELPILLPPLELQNQFAEFVQQVNKLKFGMEKSLKELQDNFNALMQRAFKGELF